MVKDKGFQYIYRNLNFLGSDFETPTMYIISLPHSLLWFKFN